MECEALTVWTPKRVLLLAAAFLLLFGAYEVYAHFLPIDGLPQLPDKYLPGPGDPEIEEPHPSTRPDLVASKLRQAFGDLCKEALSKYYPIKLELRGRNMILAAGDFNFEHDAEGRVRLSPVSVAMFSKPEPGKDPEIKKYPEINTVRAEVAYLTFDKPIYSAAELSTRKIAKGELRGNIEIVHNRRTPEPDDDIVILIDDGPLYYLESEHRLWTDKWVRVNDSLGAPRNNMVSAEGMDLYLASKREPAMSAQPASRRPKNDNVGGVERIVLRSHVTMKLWVDSNSGFLPAENGPAPSTEKSINAAGAATTESNSSESDAKDRVVITTPGPFNYDMVKNFAQFDIPPPDPHRQSLYPERVQVERSHEIRSQENGKGLPNHRSKPRNSGVFPSLSLGPLALASSGLRALATDVQVPNETPILLDQMDCEHLELQFRKKTPTAAPTSKNVAKQPPADDKTANLEIETVHATGKLVVLASEAETLDAKGTDFFYNAVTRQTILKGDPKVNPLHVNNKTFGLWILKEGNEIYANELELMNQKGAQAASARGPGCIRLLDKTTGTRPLQASWNDSFSWAPEGKLDFMTLTGNGVFYDDEHNQYLQADNLKVWLQPADTKPAANGSSPPVQNSRKPHKVEATGHVLAKSPDMKVHDSDSLNIHFKDVPPEKSASPAATKSEPTSGASVPGIVGVKPPTRTGPPAAPAKPPNPIDLSAQAVEVTVLRRGDKNELDELRCYKNVHVVQAPATPEEKGVDIVGDKLHLQHFPEGDQLVVTGDLAQLRLDKIFIVGPVVNIDQAANKAFVNGIGAMQMESQSDFQGNPLKKAVPLTIHWNKSMMFNGPDAEFHGGIQATQENAHLMCQVLQVYFDKPVNLKEGNKGGDAAKVKHLICDQKVNLHDTAYENDRVVKDQRLECPELMVDNEQNVAIAKGPNGIVRIFQPGASDNGPGHTAVGRPEAKPAAKPAEEMKLTYVSYAGVMWTDNKQRIAKFSDRVKLLNLPTKNPNLAINLDKIVDNLPIDALYLEADTLEVSDKPDEEPEDKERTSLKKTNDNKDKNKEKDKTNQEMKATGHVFVKAQEFYGRAWRVTYVEEKDQIILYGGDNGASAYLYRTTIKGADPDRIEANKIIYVRRKGEFSVDGGKTFKGRN
jgi:hypothetical protein